LLVDADKNKAEDVKPMKLKADETQPEAVGLSANNVPSVQLTS
jgi:hypothetical protein